ncbi:MAG: iron-containing alcohol dehydrogenase [Pseudomonadota bacterium]
MDRKHFAMTFDFPTSWHHGRGLAADTGNLLKGLGCKETLLVTDRLLVELGVIEPVTSSLDACPIEYTLCDEVTEEPTVNLFEGLVKKLDLKKFDSFLAVGGGSVIDVAKGLAVIAQFGGHIRDYAGFNRIPERLERKIIAVPTTAGTGSEISDGSVIIDEALQTKFLVLSTRICPTVAITDPEMTVSMPPKVTANSGVDALTHGIESYLSRDASLASEPFSLRAVELISGGLQRAYRDGQDLDARETVQIGSTMAMVAGMNAHMGLCHAMVMPLCALYHIPHGRACGMVLPHVLAFNGAVVMEKVADLFRVMGFMSKDAESSAPTGPCYQNLDNFLEKMGIAARLSDFGFQEDHMQTIVQETFNSVQCQFNPRPPSEEDIVDIVEKMI